MRNLKGRLFFIASESNKLVDSYCIPRCICLTGGNHPRRARRARRLQRKSREASETSKSRRRVRHLYLSHREEIMRGERGVSGGNHRRRARLLNHAGERDVSRGNHKVYLSHGRKSWEAGERARCLRRKSRRQARRLGRKSQEARETSREE